VHAHMWFILAADQGDDNAQINTDIAASKMTPDQIAEAQRKAREWMAKISNDGCGLDPPSLRRAQS